MSDVFIDYKTKRPDLPLVRESEEEMIPDLAKACVVLKEMGALDLVDMLGIRQLGLRVRAS